MLGIEKVYWKYILNVLIDSVMNYLKEIVSIFTRLSVLNEKSYIDGNLRPGKNEE